VYVFRDSGEVLLLRRTEQWGGFWQGVSGAPEWAETDDEGAIREVREETGFDVADSLRRIDVRYDLLRESDPDRDRWEQLYGPEVVAIPEEVYVANVPPGDPVLAPYEHDAFRWCSIDDALRLLRWENNRRALLAAVEFVASNPV
jgi:8-oxo-dGTP pyrophosphatase MutT (NUDIX family)